MRKYRKGFPKISLPEALGRAEQVYRKEHTRPAPREVVAVAMGYSGISGSSSATIAALSNFGLIENVGGDEYKISDDALSVFLHDRGDPERADAVKRLAMKPTVFSELSSKFGTVASDRNIEAYLIRNDYHPDTIRNLISAFRDTMAFMEAEVGDEGPVNETQRERERSDDIGEMPDSGDNQHASSAATSNSAPSSELVFKISRTSNARINFSGDVTQESVDKLIKLLELSRDTFPSEVDLPNLNQS